MIGSDSWYLIFACAMIFTTISLYARGAEATKVEEHTIVVSDEISRTDESSSKEE